MTRNDFFERLLLINLEYESSTETAFNDTIKDMETIDALMKKNDIRFDSVDEMRDIAMSARDIADSLTMLDNEHVGGNVKNISYWLSYFVKMGGKNGR